MILVPFICYFGYIQPYKNKAINLQELILLANLTIIVLHAVSYFNNISVKATQRFCFTSSYSSVMCLGKKVGEGTRKAGHEKTPLDHAAMIISTLASYLQMATI